MINPLSLARAVFAIPGMAADFLIPMARDRRRLAELVERRLQERVTPEWHLTQAEEEFEVWEPYCTRCGRPHPDGECGRGKAEPAKPAIESLFQAYWDAETPEVETQALDDIDRYYPEWGRYSRPIPDSAASAGADVSPAISPAGGAGPEGLSHSPRDPSGPPNDDLAELIAEVLDHHRFVAPSPFNVARCKCNLWSDSGPGLERVRHNYREHVAARIAARIEKATPSTPFRPHDCEYDDPRMCAWPGHRKAHPTP